MEIGRLCVKIAGRDAGKKCVIVDVLEGNFVLVDGATRRKRCNILHLEPLNEVLKIKKGASHADVAKEFKKLGIEVSETKAKKAAAKPTKKRKTSEKPAEEKKEKPKAAEKHKEAKAAKPKAEKKEAKPAAKKHTKK